MLQYFTRTIPCTGGYSGLLASVSFSLSHGMYVAMYACVMPHEILIFLMKTGATIGI